MNSYERVMNTIGGLSVDRVPVIAVLGIYGGRLTGTNPETLFGNPQKYANSQTAIQKTFGIDMILTPFEFSSLGEAFGGQVSYFANQAPNLRKPAAASVREALAYTEQFWLAWANALLDAGADGLILVESMAAAEIMPRTMFQTKLLPTITKRLACLKGSAMLHHGGGSINHILDLVPGLPNIIGALVSSKDNLDEARKLVGSNFLLAGNLDNLGFAAASASELYTKSLSCLNKGARRGHFILANSGADIPLATAPETIQAMMDASKYYAEYNRIPG